MRRRLTGGPSELSACFMQWHYSQYKTHNNKTSASYADVAPVRDPQNVIATVGYSTRPTSERVRNNLLVMCIVWGKYASICNRPYML